jgi:hypothetical protein
MQDLCESVPAAKGVGEVFDPYPNENSFLLGIGTGIVEPKSHRKVLKSLSTSLLLPSSNQKTSAAPVGLPLIKPLALPISMTRGKGGRMWMRMLGGDGVLLQ